MLLPRLFAATCLISAVLNTEALRDHCVDFSQAARFLAGCPVFAAGLVPLPGTQGCSMMGPLCPVTCGLCDVFFGPATCTPQDIYSNKVALIKVLQDLGVCPECKAPPLALNLSNNVYLVRPPTNLTQMESYTYTSGEPDDPCAFPGTTCDRCGATIHLQFGVPLDADIPGNLTGNIFALPHLQNLALSRASLPMQAMDMPEGGWLNFTEMTHVILNRMGSGTVPPFYTLPQIVYVRLGYNGFRGGFNNVLGAATAWGIQLDEDLQNLPFVARETLTDRLCASRGLGLISLTGTGMVGTLPLCLSSLPELIFVTIPGNFFWGPLWPFLTSPLLQYVYVGGDGCVFTGTLPETLSNATNLDQLRIVGQRLSGKIPDLDLPLLTFLELPHNEFTSAGKLGGHPEGGLIVDLSHNNFTTIPTDWWTMPHVKVLNLENNHISDWPAAGVHPVGTVSENNVLAPFCQTYSLPAFSWPRLGTLRVSNNPLSVDARTFLVSVSNLELVELSAAACSLGGILPNEGSRLAPYIDEACRSTDEGFRVLKDINLRDNRIEVVAAGPWGALSQADFSNNNLSFLHADWMSGGGGPQVVQLTGNPELRYGVVATGRCPSAQSSDGSTLGSDAAVELYADPTKFEDDMQGGYRCTELCPMGQLGRLRHVDASVNYSSLCRCLPGLYGVGAACTRCGLDEWCPGSEPFPHPCPPNTSTLGRDGQTNAESCECDYPLYRRYLSLEEWTCVQCPPNHRRVVASGQDVPCEPCPDGSYGTTCAACPPGQAAAGGSGNGCVDCTPGRYSDVAGTKACLSCGIGAYQPAAGSSFCFNCTEGKQAWRWVPSEGRFADYVTASSASDCGCRAGSRMDGEEGCQRCDEGLSCPGGLNDISVRIEEGYSSEADISIYRCWGNAKRCPGNLPPGSACASGRRDVACGRCVSGKGPRPDGTCQDCDASAEAIVPIAAVCTLLVTIIFYLVLDRNAKSVLKNHTLVSTGISVSLLLQLVHHVGLVATLSLEWVPPLSWIFEVSRLLSFDLEIMQLHCVSDMDPFKLFITKLMALAFVYASITLVHMVIVIIFHGKRFQRRKASLIICVSAFTSLCYIAIVATTAAPLQCQRHPNGKLTTRSYQSVLCWESGEHLRMVGVSLVAVAVPLAFLCLVAFAAKEYPRRLVMGDVSFVRSVSPLFSRFKADAYWYAPIHVLRSLLLGLSPVLTVVEATLLFMFLVTFVSAAVTARLVPWRVAAANGLDVLCGGAVLLLLCFAAFFVPDAAAKRDALAVIAAVIVSAALIALVVSIFCILIRKCATKSKRYAFFLCHHKAGAGAFARLLKMLLAEEVGGGKSIFVDSDDLEHLDSLFRHVREETEKVVAIWSRDLLLRPWCAGELTTAMLSKIAVAVVKMPDYARPGEQLMSSYSSFVDSEAIFEQGITDEHIFNMLSWFVELPSIEMPQHINKVVLEKLCNMLRSRSVGQLEFKDEVELQLPAGETRLGIACDPTSSTAICTAIVLEKMMLPFLAADGTSEVPALLTSGQMPPTLAAQLGRLIVICTKGCLSSLSQSRFGETLEVCESFRVSPFPVIAEEGFSFLTKEALDGMRAEDGANERNLDALIAYIQMMFKEIAPSFVAQHASEQSLRTTARNICGRVLVSQSGSAKEASLAPPVGSARSVSRLLSHNRSDNTLPRVTHGVSSRRSGAIKSSLSSRSSGGLSSATDTAPPESPRNGVAVPTTLSAEFISDVSVPDKTLEDKLPALPPQETASLGLLQRMPAGPDEAFDEGHTMDIDVDSPPADPDWDHLDV